MISCTNRSMRKTRRRYTASYRRQQPLDVGVDIFDYSFQIRREHRQECKLLCNLGRFRCLLRSLDCHRCYHLLIHCHHQYRKHRTESGCPSRFCSPPSSFLPPVLVQNCCQRTQKEKESTRQIALTYFSFFASFPDKASTISARSPWYPTSIHTTRPCRRYMWVGEPGIPKVLKSSVLNSPVQASGHLPSL